MNAQTAHSTDRITARVKDLGPDMENLYTDIHAHPELSMQEAMAATALAWRPSPAPKHSA